MIGMFLLTLALAGGCKKDDGGGKDSANTVSSLPKDRITKITRTGVVGETTVQVAYNADETVSVITATGAQSYTRTFVHTTGLTVATHIEGGYEYADSFLYDGGGRLQRNVHLFAQTTSGTRHYIRTAHFYNATGRRIRSVATSDLDDYADSVSYEWQGGDLLRTRSTSEAANEFSYEYFTDKACVVGDCLYLESLLETGRFAAPNAHSCRQRRVSGNGSAETYTYDYDGTRIAKTTQAGGVHPDTETYEYAP